MVIVLAGFGGLAWLSRHPESRLLEAAAGWPVVGGWLESRRGRPELPPPPPNEVDGSVELPFLDLAAETRERRRPPYVPWDGAGPPPLGNDPLPPRPLPGREADPRRLQEARQGLGDAKDGRVGPYRLITDVEDEELLARLDRIAGGVEAAYRRRYRLAPSGTARETIVVFQDESAYRGVQSQWGRISGLDSAGHVGHGLVMLYVGDRRAGVVARSLVHEIVHLLNRRSLGPALPPWLDEGIADDMASARFDEEGRIEPEQLELVRREAEGTIEYEGALAGLQRLIAAQRAGGLRTLRELVELDWSAFVRNADAERNYAHAAFLVRYLLAGGGDLRRGFEGFLAGVAEGGPVEPEALRAALGQPWGVLESGWRAYLLREAVAAGLGPALVTR